MKTTHWIFIGLVAALAVMTGAVLFSAQPEASAAPAGSAGGQPDGQAWPDPGVYVFFDWSNMDPTQYPYITGGHEVATWSNVETLREGQYNWTWLDSWIADNAVLGKAVGRGFKVVLHAGTLFAAYERMRDAMAELKRDGAVAGAPPAQTLRELFTIGPPLAILANSSCAGRTGPMRVGLRTPGAPRGRHWRVVLGE